MRPLDGRDGNRRAPSLACLVCGGRLAFHDSRAEKNPAGKLEVILVLRCARHGFHRVSESQPLRLGM